MRLDRRDHRDANQSLPEETQMFTNKLRTAVVALATAGALAVPASALATNPVVWRPSQGPRPAAQPTEFGNYTLAHWNRAVGTYPPNGTTYDEPGPGPGD